MHNQFEAIGKTLKGFKQEADAVHLMFVSPALSDCSVENGLGRVQGQSAKMWTKLKHAPCAP